MSGTSRKSGQRTEGSRRPSVRLDLWKRPDDPAPRADRPRIREVPVALPVDESGPSAWLRSIRFSGFTIAAITLIVLAVVVLAPGLRILAEQRHEVDALRAEVVEQQGAVDELTRQRARWDDANYLETLARTRLDYVFPGEYTYLVIDDEASVKAPDGLPISDDIQAADVDWVASMLSSVLTAGLTDAPAGETATGPASTTTTGG